MTTNTNAVFCILLEHRPFSLRIFENRVLRRIFGPKRGEIVG
jgi:hypothetical protein